MRRIALTLFILFFPITLFAQVAEGVFENKKSTLSNIDFYTSNFGISFLDISTGNGACYWPRGSDNQYFFAAGFWFGAQKWHEDSQSMQKYVTISYNPNNGRSWFVPGRIQDADTLSQEKNELYTLYRSTDFDENGNPVSVDYSYKWPIWTEYDPEEYPVGIYEPDPDQRNTSKYSEPEYISNEDFFCTFKDTDLNYYDGGKEIRIEQGFPLRLQVEQRIYTWGNNGFKDMALFYYYIINCSDDTLRDCVMAQIADIDIATKAESQAGAQNDFIDFYDKEQTLYAWTDTSIYSKEAGRGFGYVGISYIYTPEPDEKGFIKPGMHFQDTGDQIGTETFNAWKLEDGNYVYVKYDLISSGEIDEKTGPEDIRGILATGKFNMLPGDTARFAVLYNFALPAKGGEADGTEEDISDLIKGVREFRKFFYDHKLVLSVSKNGVPELKAGIKNLYPNPAFNYLKVEFASEQAFDAMIEICSLSGDILHRESRIVQPGINDIRISNLNLNSGMYILKVSNEREVFTRKFSVVR